KPWRAAALNHSWNSVPLAFAVHWPPGCIAYRRYQCVNATSSDSAATRHGRHPRGAEPRDAAMAGIAAGSTHRDGDVVRRVRTGGVLAGCYVHFLVVGTESV